MSRPMIEFYPAHPSDEKTHQLETQDCPVLEQIEPIASVQLSDSVDGD